MLDIDADELRGLPDKKLIEIASCAVGDVVECPNCGTLTAFVAAAGYNGVSSCHECDHTEKVER